MSECIVWNVMRWVKHRAARLDLWGKNRSKSGGIIDLWPSLGVSVLNSKEKALTGLICAQNVSVRLVWWWRGRSDRLKSHASGRFSGCCISLLSGRESEQYKWLPDSRNNSLFSRTQGVRVLSSPYFLICILFSTKIVQILSICKY